MKRLRINGLDLWQFESLGREASIKHFITDRRSDPSGEAFTLSYSSTPEREVVRHNRDLLSAALGIGRSQLYFPSQVHKTKIETVCGDTSKEELMETDALITNEKGICIAVMSADCVPILLFDRKNEAVGAVHSGWRGTVARILEKALQQMHSQFGTKGKDVMAGIGPSVCRESYEVGEEVINEVYNVFGSNSGLLTIQPDHKAKLDLWEANKIQLLEFGVEEQNIEVSSLCTVINNYYFFSARKGDAGRFAAGMMLV